MLYASPNFLAPEFRQMLRLLSPLILLNLRPADPRALMMGDYMALRYVEENSNSFPKDLPPSGQITLTLDENNVGTFNGLADNKSLAENEIRINYVRRSRGITFGAPRYYFQNG